MPHGVLDKIAKGFANCTRIAGELGRLTYPELQPMLGLRRPFLKSIDHFVRWELETRCATS